MRAVIVKEFRELSRDRRTVAMVIGLPLLLLIVFGFAANFTISTLTVTVMGQGASQAASQIESATGPLARAAGAAGQGAAEKLEVVSVSDTGTSADARAALRDGKSNLAIVANPGAAPVVYIDGSNIFAAQAARIAVAQLGGNVEAEVLFNPELKTSWVMIPSLIGLILTFIGMLVTSIGLVKERENGTIEQLAVMPLKASDVVLGKIVPYFILAAIDMTIVTLLGIWIFGVPFTGSVALFALGAAIYLFVVLGLGVLISTLSRTTGQAIQTALMMLLPQIMLSGIIFPLDAMAAGVRWIGYLLPLTYFAKITQGVMIRGAGLDSLWLPLVILLAMAALFFGGAVARFSRIVSPARPRRARAHRAGTTSPAQAAR